jgi:hypothetical protein
MSRAPPSPDLESCTQREPENKSETHRPPLWLGSIVQRDIWTLHLPEGFESPAIKYVVK